MAKKQKSSNATMRAVQQRREARRKRDRRNLIFLIVSVVVIVALIGAGVVWAIHASRSSGEAREFSVSSTTAQTRGMVVGASGSGAETDGAPVAEIYFDYTCAHCLQFEEQYGDKLFEDAAAGRYSLVLHPVLTTALDYQYAATYLAIAVYQNAPDKFVDIHKALTEYAYNAEANQQVSALQGDSALEAVKKIGTDAGVDPAIVNGVSLDAARQTLTDWSSSWSTWAKDQGADSVGTPMFVLDGKRLEVTQQGGYQAIYDAFAGAKSE